MDQKLKVKTEGIQNDGKDTFFNHRYEPTPYEWLTQLFSQINISKQDTFVDYGCGKGRIVFYTHYCFSCHCKGIEYNETYYNEALSNQKTYIHRDHADISFFLCKAQEYSVQPEDSIFYFFNPFSPQIFMSVMKEIEHSLSQAPRKAMIILYYPDEEYIDYLNNRSSFHFNQKIPVHPGSTNERECFLTFTSYDFFDQKGKLK